MSDYQERVKLELSSLKERLKGLVRFIESDKFSSLNSKRRCLLYDQRNIMEDYVDILTKRIKDFNIGDVK